jgi:CHAD domain-containing protein
MTNPTDAECCFGAQAILKRGADAAGKVQAVRANRDTEAVHDMRVAARRLRAALELFEDCQPDGRVRRWRKAMRRVTRALGAARDVDVQIELVSGFLQRLEQPRHRPGLQRLHLRLRQNRLALQADVIDALERLEKSHALPEMEDALGPLAARGQLSHTDLAGLAVRQRAGRAIAERLEQMLAYESCIDRPEQVEPLHAMRIAAKHLRYAMEIFSPLYGEPFGETIQEVRQVQQHLGEIHDCDVWAGFLPAFLEQERRRTLEYFGAARTMSRLMPGVDALRAERQHHRDVCWRGFVDSWQDLRRKDAWSSLYRMVAHPSEGSETPPAGLTQQEPGT